MILQVAIFSSGNLGALEGQVNAFLATLKPHQVVSVTMHSRLFPTAVTVVLVVYVT